jgi:hypothetical protein
MRAARGKIGGRPGHSPFYFALKSSRFGKSCGIAHQASVKPPPHPLQKDKARPLLKSRRKNKTGMAVQDIASFREALNNLHPFKCRYIYYTLID